MLCIILSMTFQINNIFKPSFIYIFCTLNKTLCSLPETIAAKNSGLLKQLCNVL